MCDTSKPNQARCPECGFRVRGGDSTCPMCGALAVGEQPSADKEENNFTRTLPEYNRSEPQAAWMAYGSPELPMGTAAGSLHPQGEANTSATIFQPFRNAAPHATGWKAIEEADVLGRVITVENSHTEPPDFDVFRALTRLLWGLLLLTAPFMLFGLILLVLEPVRQ